MYARLDVVAEERGESFYNSRIPDTVKALEAIDGLVSTSDNGALTVFLETIPFGCMGEGAGGASAVKRQKVNYPLFLRKGDGGYGYDSTDMTAIKHRLMEMDVDWVRTDYCLVLFIGVFRFFRVLMFLYFFREQTVRTLPNQLTATLPHPPTCISLISTLAYQHGTPNYPSIFLLLNLLNLLPTYMYIPGGVRHGQAAGRALLHVL